MLVGLLPEEAIPDNFYLGRGIYQIQYLRQKQPEILITVNFRLTWGGGMLNMADHRWVALAVLDAARDAGNRWIFPARAIHRRDHGASRAQVTMHQRIVVNIIVAAKPRG